MSGVRVAVPRAARGRLIHSLQAEDGHAPELITCDRDQAMLLPPDLRDWLSDDGC